MARLLTLIVLGGCGRIGFDAVPGPGDSVLLLHDEDGDGVPDTTDVCPHLPGSQLDSDGDRVGDDCDPEPLVARQRIALFATMQPSDQPFTLSGPPSSQQADAVYFPLGGGLAYDMVAVDIRIAVGADVIGVIGPVTTSQHQLSVAEYPGSQQGVPTPHLFVELNEGPGFSSANVTRYDGTYVSLATQGLISGIHPGPVFLQTTQTTTATGLDGGWPGEPYNLLGPTTIYQGGNWFSFIANAVELEVRYVCVITST